LLLLPLRGGGGSSRRRRRHLFWRLLSAFVALFIFFLLLPVNERGYDGPGEAIQYNNNTISKVSSNNARCSLTTGRCLARSCNPLSVLCCPPPPVRLRRRIVAAAAGCSVPLSRAGSPAC